MRRIVLTSEQRAELDAVMRKRHGNAALARRAFRQAKRLTDPHAPVLEQRALASLIDSGAYERHVRRVRRENERRRAGLLDAIADRLPADARVVGAAAGLHVVLWLPSLRQQDEP